MAGYEYFEHTADVGFIARGQNLEELFENSAKALMNVMINLEGVEEQLKREITLMGGTLEVLLYNWLSELLFIFDVEELIFKRFNMRIVKVKNEYFLRAEGFGEKFNVQKHGAGVEVKAVTYHMLEVKRENSWFKAKVLLDI